MPNKMSLPHNNKLADADGDGLVDKEEFQKMFDLDGDGNVGQGEMEKAAKMFAMADKDGDGQLTAEEIKQVWWQSLRTRRYATNVRSRACSFAPRRLRTRQRRRSKRATLDANTCHEQLHESFCVNSPIIYYEYAKKNFLWTSRRPRVACDAGDASRRGAATGVAARVRSGSLYCTRQDRIRSPRVGQCEIWSSRQPEMARASSYQKSSQRNCVLSFGLRPPATLWSS